MRKTPTLFVRDPENMSRVTDTVNPGCEWVFEDPAAVPTRKFDGTCVMLHEGGTWWARHEVKPGKQEPRGFALVEHDETTGKSVGWVPMETSSWAKWLDEAVAMADAPLLPGTYELIGPKINRNPEGTPVHTLVRHDDAQVITITRGGPPVRVYNAADVEMLVAHVAAQGVEGVVWHHPDGRMAKIKARDYGFKVGS